MIYHIDLYITSYKSFLYIYIYGSVSKPIVPL